MKIYLISLLVFSFGFLFLRGEDDTPLYLDPKERIEDRVDDLLSRMTLEEKIGQMCQYVGLEHLRKAEKYASKEDLENNDQQGYYPGITSYDVIQYIESGKIGSFLHVTNLEEANELQKIAQKSRLKIPLLLGIDAIHGNALVKGTTVFPTQLTLSSSWDDDLLFRVAQATAREVRAGGSHWTFSPNVEVARDPRWGRCGETFGEDPFLVAQLGAAFTRGYQGNFGKDNVLACAKHFVAGAEPVNGTNASPMDASKRQIREIWFPPFKEQVDAGVKTFMAAHNDLNGVPCHANHWLLNEVLRDEWGFEGFVVSDWMDIERLHSEQKVAKTQKEAAKLAVNAGVDMHMHGPKFFERLLELVNEGKVPEETVTNACRKILETKFLLGLFEDPFVDPEESAEIFFDKESRELALEAARKSIVLLKNESQLLPLQDKAKILVTGPNANNQRTLGDWSQRQPDENVTTVYEGMKKIFAGGQVDFINCGTNIRKPAALETEEAAAKAAEYEAVVVVVGSNSLRFERKEKTCGENVDRANIDLMGNQLELIKSIYENNKNVIVVLVNGRPLSEPWIKENIPAIIEAWEPGSYGGEAIAEIIRGHVNPSGKLTMSFPYSVGQLVYTYNHKNMHYFHRHIDLPSSPLWHFGYGLSYTTFEYGAPVVENKSIEKGDSIGVSVTVRNTGTVAGDEIVQLYVRDEFASVTRPAKELKAYQRVSLEPGESRKVTFSLPYSALGFYNREMDFVVEPGEFTIMVGKSSKDEDLQPVKIKAV